MSVFVQVSAGEADKRISELLDRVESGEEVIIARDGRPIARLVPARSASEPEAAKATTEAFRDLREKIRRRSGTFTIEEILSSIREGWKC
jgi:prevent-host-death family protein